MKKVLVIGASGSLAKYVIEALKELGNVELSLLARSKKSISNQENATIAEADVMDYAKLKNAIVGQDIVYVNLCRKLGSNDQKHCKGNAGNGREKNYCHQFHRYL
jgi:putative NADH-flavin reductase